MEATGPGIPELARQLRTYRVIAVGWIVLIAVLWAVEARTGTLTASHTVTHACSVAAGAVACAALWSRSLRWPRVHAVILSAVTACLAVRLVLDAATGAGVPAASFVVLHIPVGMALTFLSARAARAYAAGVYMAVCAAAAWAGGVDPSLPLFTAASLVVLAYVAANGQQATTQRMSMLAYRDMAYRDALTGTFNRRFAEELLRRLLDRRRPLTVALLDLDHFKTLNDTLGHAHGDHALREVVAALRGAACPGATVTRWGGEEFLVIFEDVPPAEVRAVVEAMRRAVRALPVARPLTVTFSGGVAEHDGARALPDLLAAADARLYAAKAHGRDRVVYPDPDAAVAAPPVGARTAGRDPAGPVH